MQHLPIRLADLNPEFYRVVVYPVRLLKLRDGITLDGPFVDDDYDEVIENREHHFQCSKEEAGTVVFFCPLCFFKNGGSEGTHRVSVPFRAPFDGKESRWSLEGDLQDLTLSPSILMAGPGCGWHGFVSNGMVTAAK